MNAVKVAEGLRAVADGVRLVADAMLEPSPMLPLAPIWLDVAAFAQRHGVAEGTVRAWVRRGCPTLKRQGGDRLRVRDADAWVVANVPPRPGPESDTEGA